MRAFPLQIALLAVAALLALGAAISTVAAAELAGTAHTDTAQFQEGEADEGSGIDVVPVAAWTAAGIAVGAVVFGVLYMLKRRLGGFPANPEWVAPITIMQSKDFPDETTFGGDDAGHGHVAAAH